MLWSIGLCWFTGLVLAKLPLATSVQVFYSKWAEVVDAPTNIRKSPSSPSAIVFQLPRNGMVLLVYPLGTDPNQQASCWYATLACQSGTQSRTIGLGSPPSTGINPRCDCWSPTMTSGWATCNSRARGSAPRSGRVESL